MKEEGWKDVGMGGTYDCAERSGGKETGVWRSKGYTVDEGGAATDDDGRFVGVSGNRLAVTSSSDRLED